MATTIQGPAAVSEFIEELNVQYEKVHKAFEDNFWATKMSLKGASGDALNKTKSDLDNFLGDQERLVAVREHLKNPELHPDQEHVLHTIERTLKCYIVENPTAKELQEKVTVLETELGAARGGMKLGYTDPKSGDFIIASSVQLRNKMDVEDEEELRKACYEGLCSIGPFVAERFIEIVKLRNRFARLMGFQDFYDYKVTLAEGFGKTRLFEMLDDLESKTRQPAMDARAELAKAKGESVLLPYNMPHAIAGDVSKAMDPYFPFEDAVDVWARTFAALGIDYKGSVMTLDLCERQGKYSNGFCHWPQPAWRKADGSWVPARANFTSLASPHEVGSGRTALVTLLHEGGHAAHFANVDQRSPLFAQERAPTSVAYAENQSMFLDSLADDAAWLSRYARTRTGEVVPWALVEAQIRSQHPLRKLLMCRSMLAVPYFEKALYEMSEEELTVDALLALEAKVEQDIQGGPASRPLLSVPHILADESSCYYHGYVLAEMSVHQTRQYFAQKYGRIVDNPEVGKELTQSYWRPGNGAAFLSLVESLTGSPLSAEAWVHELSRPIAKLLEEERKEYDEGLAAGPTFPPGADVSLGMRVRLVHGDEVIADSEEAGGLNAANTIFKGWVRRTFFKEGVEGTAPAAE